MVRLRADSYSLRKRLRQREIETVFRAVPPDTFNEALELGGGDGFQSRFLALYAKRVLCTDLNPNRLIQEPHPRVSYDLCDAEHLPYETGRFDLIYSSNLLEHLPEPRRALLEMHRVLKDDGVMVHVVPNRLWKVLQFALFIPSQLLSVVEIIVNPDRRKTIGRVEDPANNPRRKPAGFLMRNLWPAVHGESPNHVVEFSRMGAPYWDREFSEAGFQVSGHVAGLPANSPYRFGLTEHMNVLEKIGLSSYNGYVLMKSEGGQERTGFFPLEKPK